MPRKKFSLSLPSISKILVFVGIILIAILITKFFAIKNIDCLQNNLPCSERIQDILSRLKDKNIIILNQKTLKSNILTNYPAKDISVGFRLFNTLTVNITGDIKNYPVQMYLVQSVPPLSVDRILESSDSAILSKPSEELESMLSTKTAQSFVLWEDGTYSPSATISSQIRYIFSEVPTKEILSSVYRLVTLSNKYLSNPFITVINTRVFLSQTDRPDIIALVPFDEDSFVAALKSFDYLATIKKDAKIIDLRFKNPVIR